MVEAPPERRPLTSRQAPWAQAIARWLTRIGASPNAISASSMVMALGAGAALAALPMVSSMTERIALLIAAIIGIQLRLLCNLFDGMVAVEGGRRSPTGDLWNEVPDRIADSLILVGAGYGVIGWPGAPALGWCAALLAALTAYVRTLGKGLGLPGLFLGPMAKPQRMAVLTAAAAAQAALISVVPWGSVLYGALMVVVIGAAVTVWRRLAAIAHHLRNLPCSPG